MNTLKLLIAATAALAFNAHAGTVGIHVGSWHDQPGFNNVNPGVYYKTDNGWVAGTYYNSIRKQSVYAGYAFEYGPFAVVTGVVTGYRKSPMPMIAPSISYRGVRLTVIPKVPQATTTTAIHLSYEFTIN